MADHGRTKTCARLHAVASKESAAKNCEVGVRGVVEGLAELEHAFAEVSDRHVKSSGNCCEERGASVSETR